MPLLRENESIGTILLRRTEVQPFTDKQIALLDERRAVLRPVALGGEILHQRNLLTRPTIVSSAAGLGNGRSPGGSTRPPSLHQS